MATRSWASSLRLPKTSFPARASPSDQAKYLQRTTSDLYKWQLTNRPTESTFVLHDGPPYANGGLHIGHALNKVLKDMINRTQLRRGRRVHYIPGWDCHGMPIEHKALGQRPDLAQMKDSKARAVETRKAARELATETVKMQMEGFKQWGVMGDWERAYKTMGADFEMRQLGVFKKMVERGLIYRRFKPVYWSPSSGTALAEAELEYDEKHKSFSAVVKFPLSKISLELRDKLGLEESEEIAAAIWTTTPWTLPANRAIAVRPDMEYVLLQSATHGKLIIAEARVQYLQDLMKEEEFKILRGSILGSELAAGAEYQGFFGNGPELQPVIEADFVTADSGTGLVHCAPGHGMDDYLVCLARGIEAFAPVDGAGRFTDQAFPSDPSRFSGQHVQKEGNRCILDFLEEQGHVLNRHKYVHKYPVDWRTKQPIIVRATEQWFADVSDIRDQAVQALQEVNFIPSTGKARLESLIRNRSEWCISRQRAWGVPIPALYNANTEEAVMTADSVQHIMNVIEQKGIDAWWNDAEDSSDWIPADLRSDGKTYRRGTDTMDVWFDSGTSWSLLEQEGHPPPADVYLEGKDQHRGWFQSSLLTNVATQSSQAPIRPPFKALITHGFTLDSAGRKMSKSIGNIIAPSEIIEGTLLPPLKQKKQKAKENAEGTGASAGKGLVYDSLGPDMLRLWVASSDYTKDVVIGTPILKAVTSALQKYRVTFKLLLGALEDFNPSDTKHIVSFTTLAKIDQHALIKVNEMTKSTEEAFANYEFYKAFTALNKWLNNDFSAFYIEAVKDRLYADAADSIPRRSVQTVLWHVLCQMQSTLDPICPLLVEESWEHSTGAMKEFWNDKMPACRTVEEVAKSQAETANAKYIINSLEMVLAPSDAVKIAQERARKVKAMGSSAQSYVTLMIRAPSTNTSESEAGTAFTSFGEEALAELYVVSKVHVDVASGLETDEQIPVPQNVLGAKWMERQDFELPGGISGTAFVYAPENEKCQRCWKYVVEKAEEESGICGRCRDVVGNPEV